jgi:hypothetical protein
MTRRKAKSPGPTFRVEFHERPLEPPEIAVIQKAAHHLGRDLLGAERVKLVSGRGVDLSIGAVRRSLETSMDKLARFDHHHAGNAAIWITVGPRPLAS